MPADRWQTLKLKIGEDTCRRWFKSYRTAHASIYEVHGKYATVYKAPGHPELRTLRDTLDDAMGEAQERLDAFRERCELADAFRSRAGSD